TASGRNTSKPARYIFMFDGRRDGGSVIADGAGEQTGIHGDGRMQQLGDWAPRLGSRCSRFKSRLVGAWHASRHIQMDRRNGKSVRRLLQGDGGRRLDPLGSKACLTQLSGERHRETSGVGGADQLFRVGAGRTFEAGVESIWGSVQ